MAACILTDNANVAKGVEKAVADKGSGLNKTIDDIGDIAEDALDGLLSHKSSATDDIAKGAEDFLSHKPVAAAADDISKGADDMFAYDDPFKSESNFDDVFSSVDDDIYKGLDSDLSDGFVDSLSDFGSHIGDSLSDFGDSLGDFFG